MAGQTFGTCGYGTYSQVNIEGCPPLIRALTFLCGFPLPCCCGCWACGCGEGPCGFSCSKVRGKGLSQFLLKAELNDVNPVKKFGKRNSGIAVAEATCLARHPFRAARIGYCALKRRLAHVKREPGVNEGLES